MDSDHFRTAHEYVDNLITKTAHANDSYNQHSKNRAHHIMKEAEINEDPDQS
mgnify:CR=1 FL=1